MNDTDLIILKGNIEELNLKADLAILFGIISLVLNLIILILLVENAL